MKADKEEELLSQLTAKLDILDAQFDDHGLPSLPELEQLIASEATRRHRQNRKELLVFVLIALILLSIFLTAMGTVPVLYWVLQAAFPLAALGILAILRVMPGREDAEE